MDRSVDSVAPVSATRGRFVEDELADMVAVLASGDLVAAEGADTDIHRVQVEGTDVLVARLGSGRVVAFGALCPHQLTDLSQATLFDGKVRCPRHNYLYDPGSGENVLPTRDCRPENLWKLAPGYLPSYRAADVDGSVFVARAPQPPPPSYDPDSERPPAPGAATSPTASGLRTNAAPKAPAGPVEHPAATLRVAAGSTFEVALATIPKPGFVWRIVVPSELLRVVEERFETSDPPRHRVKMAARASGTGTVRCIYVRPWETTPAEIRTYEVTVEPA